MECVTKIFIIVVIAVVLIYDAYVLVRHGSDATVSCVILKSSLQYPLIPFLAGMLCGHLFAPIRIMHN
jgi:hypothetical protein